MTRKILKLPTLPFSHGAVQHAVLPLAYWLQGLRKTKHWRWWNAAHRLTNNGRQRYERKTIFTFSFPV